MALTTPVRLKRPSKEILADLDAAFEAADGVPVPELHGPRTVTADGAVRRVLERPVRRTPEPAELHELRSYLARHCWTNGTPVTECIHTTRLLLHLYGGRFQGGWPDRAWITLGQEDTGSGYWYRGVWWHHCWLEQTRPGGEVLLIDLTSGQFPGSHQTPAFTFAEVGALPRYRPTHKLAELARSASYRPTRERSKRWVDSWTAAQSLEP